MGRVEQEIAMALFSAQGKRKCRYCLSNFNMLVEMVCSGISEKLNWGGDPFSWNGLGLERWPVWHLIVLSCFLRYLP